MPSGFGPLGIGAAVCTLLLLCSNFCVTSLYLVLLIVLLIVVVWTPVLLLLLLLLQYAFTVVMCQYHPSVRVLSKHRTGRPMRNRLIYLRARLIYRGTPKIRESLS